MTDKYHDPNWTEQITIPVKRIGDRWEFFYGGDVPVKEGTLGQLKIDADALEDWKFRDRLTQQAMVRILDEGATLLVALSDHTYSALNLWGEFPMGVPLGATRVLAVQIGPVREKKKPKNKNLPVLEEKGGLWLSVKGLDQCVLQSSTIKLPADFGGAVALSLNHAFTLLSERYEKHRIAHTGNVYERVFYQDKDLCWYPLKDLRQGALVSAERKLLSETWVALEQQLGWRPIGQQAKKK